MQRRAAGRNHHNSVRRLRAFVRRAEVAELLRQHGYRHGVQVRIARRLGVSPATISRAVAWILAIPPRCPRCGYQRGAS